MKKKLLLIGSLFYIATYSQQGKVGINTENPSATLDIVSKANTSATKALKISNSSSTEMVTVRDNGQVGINQASPATDALLELNAANKSLLLTRVNNVTDIANPVNGMLAYDITQACVRAYENSAWSGCLSAGGGGGGGSTSAAFSWQTNLRFKQYANTQFDASNFLSAGGVTTDGKVFFWGRDYYGTIQNYNGASSSPVLQKPSPVYMSGAGYWGDGNAVKVQLANDAYYVLDVNGNIWAFGSQQNGQLGDGVNAGSVTQIRTTPQLVIKPTGVTKFIDMAMRMRTFVVLGDNGKAYYYGRNESTGAAASTAVQIPFPSGVTAYTKIWMPNQNTYSLFLLGNDGNLYFTGYQNTLSGDATIASGTSTLTYGTSLVKVNLPAGEAAKLVKVDADYYSAFGLTNEGKLYAWGRVRFDYGASAPSIYGTLNEYMFSDENNITIVYNQYSHRTYYAYEPKLVKLPTGETSFIDATSAATTNQFICASGKAYVLGYEYYTNEAGALGTPTDSANGYKDYQIIYALEYVSNIKQISSAGYSTLVMDADGKLWGYGDNRYCMSGAGFRCPSTISTALPLMDGNLDPNNPRPQTVN